MAAKKRILVDLAGLNKLSKKERRRIRKSVRSEWKQRIETRKREPFFECESIPGFDARQKEIFEIAARLVLVGGTLVDCDSTTESHTAKINLFAKTVGFALELESKKDRGAKYSVQLQIRESGELVWSAKFIHKPLEKTPEERNRGFVFRDLADGVWESTLREAWDEYWNKEKASEEKMRAELGAIASI